MSRTVRVLGLVTIIAVLMVVTGFVLSSTYGITRTTSNGQDYQSIAPHYPFIYFDGLDFLWFDHREQADTITFDGYLWRDSTAQTTWRVVHTGGVRLTLDDRVVFEQTERLTQARVDEVTLSFNGQAVKLQAEYRTDILRQLAPFHEAPTATYVQARGGREVMFAIYERDALGAWRLLPTHQLYTTLPDSTQAQTRAFAAGVSLVGKLLAVVALVSLILVLVVQRRVLRLPMARWALVIFVLALAVRLVVLWERSLNDGMFTFSNPSNDNYVLMARRTLGGNNFFAPAFYQPGSIVWFILLTHLFGPHVTGLYIVNAIASAVGVLLIFLSAYRVAGLHVARISGIIASLYAVWLFYSVTLQDTVLIALIVPFLMYSVENVYRYLSVRWAILAGIFIGIGTLTRVVTAFMGVAYSIVLFFIYYPKLRLVIAFSFVTGLSAITLIFPQTIMNIAAGNPAFINTSGSFVLYAGNTRDSDGTVGGQALSVALARDQAFEEALREDVQADPMRSLELILHKWGTFWGNYDIPANVDFYAQGVQSSALLRVLDLGGLLGTPILLVLGITGLGLMLAEKPMRAFGGWLLLSLVLITFTSILFAVAGRMRISVWPLLFVGAAFALDALWRRQRLRRTLVLLIASALLVLLVGYFERHLPYKRYWTGDLPSDSVIRNESFGESVTLLGHAPLETDFRAGGYVYLTVYWDVPRPTETNQQVAVLVLDSDGGEYARLDVPLGSITYPPVGTSQWPSQGARLRESYLVNLPEGIGDSFVVALAVDDAVPRVLAEVTLTPPRITYHGIVSP